MLTLQTIQNAKMSSIPFEWVKLYDLISNKDLRHALIETYPVENLREEIKSNDEDKSYQFLIKSAVLKNKKQPCFKELPLVWQNLIDQIVSEEYRNTVEKLVNINLIDKPIDVSFFAFGENHWVSPHTDKKSKIVSHVLYFNNIWNKEWGGSFRLLNSAEPNDVFEDILPLSQLSVLFKRSVNSWHMVTPVKKCASNFRMTLQIEFWDELQQ